MIAGLLAILFTATLICALVLLARERLEAGANALATLSAIGTLIALAVGAAWYFVERPEAAKLKIEHASAAYPLDGQFALIVAEVSITNLGKTALRLKDQPYKVILQRISPAPPDVNESLSRARTPSGLPAIESADSWDGGLLAEFPTASLSTIIEAGETENLYFRARVDCSRNARVYLQTQIEKRKRRLNKGDEACDSQHICWIKQSIIDITQACKEDVD